MQAPAADDKFKLSFGEIFLMTDQDKPYGRDFPDGIRLSVDAIEALDRLFSSVSPLELREHLLEIYHTYIVHAHHTLPLDFEKMAMNMYLLINCLGSMGENRDEMDIKDL